MSVRYFAKYVVVSGKPKVGDMVMSTDGYYDRIESEDQIQETDKLLKLYLCSSELTTGLYVIHNNPLNKERYNTIIKLQSHDTEKGLYYSEDGGVFTEQELVHTIAPISPKATWVQEGDVFGQGNYSGMEKSKPADNWEYRFQISNYAKIRCSHCKNFH